ncbi:phosphatase PAP2 family protein [Mesorhizobium japonicum]|uniref:Mlr8056 protein n=1 Tax=Mesorhizobium japonicum (strain LMG 29417 / CECT 9101 / MAFF 303099) TaxID=266835 RepID=Q984C9_RHILO|nr:phosphatase PAP2 family protein [Mesorhizobium japonicum]BAB53701.1 mlr8056 [Mesorhizobium japonicum MAFF 303099]
MDVAITQWINAAAGTNTALDKMMVGVTTFGVPLLIACVALQWWSKTDRVHVRHATIVAGLSFLIGLGANQIILLFVHRMRPYEAGITHLIIPTSADWSFPSDHATAAFAIVAAFALQALPGRALVFGSIAVLVAWSRVYVGTHYMTDVLGGALMGICAAGLVSILYREGSRLDRIATGIL